MTGVRPGSVTHPRTGDSADRLPNPVIATSRACHPRMTRVRPASVTHRVFWRQASNPCHRDIPCLSSTHDTRATRVCRDTPIQPLSSSCQASLPCHLTETHSTHVIGPVSRYSNPVPVIFITSIIPLSSNRDASHACHRTRLAIQTSFPCHFRASQHTPVILLTGSQRMPSRYSSCACQPEMTRDSTSNLPRHLRGLSSSRLISRACHNQPITGIGPLSRYPLSSPTRCESLVTGTSGPTLAALSTTAIPPLLSS
jgi:hypothetical protein